MGTKCQMSLHIGKIPSCYGPLDRMSQDSIADHTYRQDVFLPRLAELDKTFVRWTYPDPEGEEPVLIYPPAWDPLLSTRP